MSHPSVQRLSGLSWSFQEPPLPRRYVPGFRYQCSLIPLCLVESPYFLALQVGKHVSTSRYLSIEELANGASFSDAFLFAADELDSLFVTVHLFQVLPDAGLGAVLPSAGDSKKASNIFGTLRLGGKSTTKKPPKMQQLMMLEGAGGTLSAASGLKSSRLGERPAFTEQAAIIKASECLASVSFEVMANAMDFATGTFTLVRKQQDAEMSVANLILQMGIYIEDDADVSSVFRFSSRVNSQ